MSNTPEHVKCLIIGSGPAGFSAAIYAARADLKPLMIEGPLPGGQLTQTTEVDNYPGYPLGRSGPEMMEDLRKQALRFETEIRNGWVTKVDLTGPVHKVWVDEKTEIHADAVIISTGASAKWLGLPNEIRLRDIGGGVTACAVCDGFFYKGQNVALVGAGDSACEEATYLAKLCPKVYMLVRKGEFRASKAMVHRVENTPNIEVLYNTEVKDVLGANTVEGIMTINNSNGVERKLDVTGLFIAIGHTPATELFKDWLDMDDAGYLKHVADRTSTKIPGVFVAGDAADKVYRQAVTSAGSGCMAALDAERYLAAAGMHEDPAMPTIKGTFDITGTPQPNTEGSEAVGAMRMVFRKTFHGPLEGTGVVEMMGIMYKETLSGAYVALEKITGSIDGRTGSFCMQHGSTMARGVPEQRIAVVPDSGTGELEGLSGSLTIDIMEKVHHYTFTYELSPPGA